MEIKLDQQQPREILICKEIKIKTLGMGCMRFFIDSGQFPIHWTQDCEI